MWWSIYQYFIYCNSYFTPILCLLAPSLHIHGKNSIFSYLDFSDAQQWGFKPGTPNKNVKDEYKSIFLGQSICIQIQKWYIIYNKNKKSWYKTPNICLHAIFFLFQLFQFLFKDGIQIDPHPLCLPLLLKPGFKVIILYIGGFQFPARAPQLIIWRALDQQTWINLNPCLYPYKQKIYKQFTTLTRTNHPQERFK